MLFQSSKLKKFKELKIKMENQNTLRQKFGLVTAICLVVGAVIGSGIFFLNETIFGAVGGNLFLAVMAWVIGGAIMFVMMWNWGQLAKRYEGMNGLMDYSDQLVGRRYSYFMSWFLGTILYPSFVAVLAWVSARFSATLFGWDDPNTGGTTWMLAGVFLVFMYVMNAIAPRLAGRFQVSTTIIKVVPLILMAVVGLIFGLVNGVTADNIGTAAPNVVTRSPFYVAILATVFAYAGSEEVLMMNKEIRNSRRNLPRAIIIGSLIIIAIYVTYTIGIFGATDIGTLASPSGVRNGFANVFGNAMGSILLVFVIISCLGAMNSAMMAGTRTFYSIAERNMGPAPSVVGQVDPKTNMPPTSAAMHLLCSGIILFIVFANASGWFAGITAGLGIPITSLMPITLMAFYIPIFISIIIRCHDWHWFNRFVMPVLSIIGAGALIYMTFDTNWRGALWYMLFFSTSMGIAVLFMVNWRRFRRGQSQDIATETEVIEN